MEPPHTDLGRGRAHPIRWLHAHPAAADMILAITLTAASIAVHVLEVEDPGSPGVQTSVDPAWWTVLLIFAAVFPIAWRRSHTILSAAVVVTAQVVTEVADVEGTGFIGVLIAIYSLGAHSEGAKRTRLLVPIVLAISTLFIMGLVVDELDLGSLISSTIILATAFVLGDNLRRRRDTALAAEERAARAERERELLAEQQINAERTRIARELHDVVAHSVSVMVIQAAAARRSLESSPANVEIALSNIEETGRQTMNELRGILGVLRRSDPLDASDPTTAPQPSLAHVADLSRVSIDLPVNLDIDADLGELPQSVSLTGYRVVQEALTNIRRHAGPVTRVDITVSRSEGEVDIRITDDGRGAAADASGPGYGLLGMRERVEAVGGHLRAGSRHGGGWQIAARLPIDANASSSHRRDASTDAAEANDAATAPTNDEIDATPAVAATVDHAPTVTPSDEVRT